MPVGEIIRLSEDEVTEVKYLRTLMTVPKKNLDRQGNAVVPIPYAQMRFGPVSFTINTAEDVAIVENAATRDDIYSMTLEVTEFEEDAIDDQGNPIMQADGVTPQVNRRRGLAFVALQTYTSRQAREMKKVSLQGAVHAEKVKFGLIEQPANVDAVAEKLLALMEKKEAKAEPVAA